MNNNSIKKKILGNGTMCLVAGLFLFLSCGSNDDLSGDGEGNLSKPYLALKQYGFNKFLVSNDTEDATFSLAVKKHGGKTNSELTAKLDVWSKEELDAYNEKEKTSYVFLPESYYTLTSKNLVFGSDTDEMNVEVKVKVSKIISKMQQGVNYVIALKLNSEDAALRKRQSDLLLHVVIDYANVGFVSPDVVGRINVKESTTYAKIKTFLYHKVDGKEQGSSWDFSCELKVPKNANEMVAAYNIENNSNCELLPSNSYTLGNVRYTIGDKEAEGTISINRDAIKVKYYLLPLTLTNVSTGKVACKNEIYYVVVGQTYTNPVIMDRTLGDPTVFRDQDGRFYLYSTQNSKDWMPIYSSTDLVNWKYERNAFSNATKPNWQNGNAFWAPEMQYINGKYVLYFSWAKMNGAAVSHTAVVTADSPLGPFPNSKPLLKNDEFGSNCIDQFYYEDNGKKYMFYGSFQGIYVTELEDDGLSVKRDHEGKPTMNKKVCGNAFEGTNIYKKNGYYYLFASVGSCCASQNSTYHVVVGRSNSLFGPYLDKEGKDMLNNSWELVMDGGDRTKWVGPGHNSVIIKDDEGTEWMIYHSYCYMQPDYEFGGRFGMLDRLQWTDDGWPYIKNKMPSAYDLIPVFN